MTELEITNVKEPSKDFIPLAIRQNLAKIEIDIHLSDEDFCKQPEYLTPVGNAVRFIRDHAHACFYHAERCVWYYYDGKVWRLDDIDLMRVFAQMTAKKIAFGSADPMVLQWQKKSLCKSQLDEMVELAKTYLAKWQSDLDRDPFLFNVQNGTIDLRTGTIRPHRSDDFITMISKAEYDPAAECPLFEKFLDDFTSSNAELKAYHGRWAGYLMTGDTSERKMLTLVGDGANGKGVYVDTLKAILGEYYKTVQAESLMQKKFANGSGPSSDIARLESARAAFISEVDRSGKLNESLMKQMSGQDQVTSRKMYKEDREFTPQCKFVFQTNYLPKVRGTDEAIWQRQAVVKCIASFPPEKMDRDLRKKLAGEASGILNWMLQGALEWQKQGLAPEPKVVKKAVEQYRIDSDNVTRFLQENTVSRSDAMVLRTTLYQKYKDWTEEEGEQYVASSREFQDIVERLSGVKYKKTNKGHFWTGIELGTASEQIEIPSNIMKLFTTV